MYNHFIYIWNIIKQWVIHIQAKTWKLIGSLIVLIVLIYFFICIHQIERVGVEYHVIEMRGLSTKGGYATLNFNINNGLLFERDLKTHNNLEIHHNFDLKLDELGIINKDYHKHENLDSLLIAFGLDSINRDIKHVYKIRRKDSRYSHTHKLNYNEIDTLYRDSTQFVLAPTPSIKSKHNNIFTYKHVTSIDRYIIPIDSHARSFSHSSAVWIKSFNSFPSIFKSWDISQKTYKINYYSDGYDIDIKNSSSKVLHNTYNYQNNKLISVHEELPYHNTSGDSTIIHHYFPKTNGIDNTPQPTTPLKELKVNFGGPTEFFAMNPEPDVMTVSGFEFTDPLKLRQIMRDGIEFHAKFPQTESLQSARIFVVTTLISIFTSLVFTLGYQIIKAKYDKGKLRRSKGIDKNIQID